MHTTYRMSAADLDDRFLASVKSLFGANEVEISICGRAQSEEDETAYLLTSEANRQHLLEALADVEAGRNLVTVKPEELAVVK
jgi:antitoxin YefM